MIDKDYLDKLKKEDYIAYDDLVNNPMIVGVSSGGSLFMPILIVLIIVILIIVI